jgi:hypothetical protein
MDQVDPTLPRYGSDFIDTARRDREWRLRPGGKMDRARDYAVFQIDWTPQKNHPQIAPITPILKSGGELGPTS